MRVVLASQSISMKSLLSVCLVAGSAWIASSSLTHTSGETVPQGASFFLCSIDGKSFSTVANDSSLDATFTYCDNNHLSPSALFINAVEKKDNSQSSFYIQPINDDAPAAPLTANNNLYKSFYITYKATDNTFYNTTTAPGNFEITTIDTVHKIVTGKLNCILYSSTKKSWLLISNGRFSLKF
jgi:hypothetical protein